jgi:flagellar biosynthesis/type III secretory pathway protein FliH
MNYAGARKRVDDITRRLELAMTAGHAEGLEQGRKQGREEGRTRALGEAVVEVLESRGLFVNELQRDRLLSCSDRDMLETWLRHAATARTAAEVFASSSTTDEVFEADGSLVRGMYVNAMSRGREEGRDEGLRDGYERGRLDAWATAVLTLLEARDVLVDDVQRQIVLSCSDLEVLDAWLARASTATSTAEVFGNRGPAPTHSS